MQFSILAGWNHVDCEFRIFLPGYPPSPQLTLAQQFPMYPFILWSCITLQCHVNSEETKRIKSPVEPADGQLAVFI